jgi:hypothetical protein
MPLKERIARELEASHATVRTVLGTVPDAQWLVSHDGWSAAETAHHLLLTGRMFLQGARTVVSRGPAARRIGLFGRVISAPVPLVRYRLLRVKAPESVMPHGPLPERFELMAQLESLWRETAEFIEGRSDAELRALAMRHPFFGWTPMGKMFRIMAAHELRHLDQLGNGG